MSVSRQRQAPGLVGVGGRQGEGCAAPRCIAWEVWGVLRDPAPCSGAGCLHQEHHPRQQMELHWVYSEGHGQGRADTKVMCFFWRMMCQDGQPGGAVLLLHQPSYAEEGFKCPGHNQR